MNEQRTDFSRVSMRRGFAWILASGDLLGRQLGPLAGVAGLWLLVSLIQFVPVVGPLILAIGMPLLTAGLLFAFHLVANGQSPSPSALFIGWRQPPIRFGLLALGLWVLLGFFAAAMIVFGWISAQVGAEALEQALQDPETMVQVLEGHSVMPGIVIGAAVAVIIMASLYFAIPLVLFRRQPAFRALGLSLKACLFNLPAMVAFIITVIILALALGLIMSVVVSFFTLALGEQIGGMLAQILVLVIMLFIQLLLAGAQYVAFRDIFGLDVPGPESADTGHLIA